MFKHVLSALVISSVMAGGAAFAADPATTSSPQAKATSAAAEPGDTGARPTPNKTHRKVVHKQVQAKATVVKSDAAPAKFN